MRFLRILNRILLWGFAAIGFATTLAVAYLYFTHPICGGRQTAARAQISNVEGVLELYQMDSGTYPTTEQGLAALVAKPTAAPVPEVYPPGGYLRGGRVPLDPWGNPYQYRSPGLHKPDLFDLWSYGADGAEGGEGPDADVCNWEGGWPE